MELKDKELLFKIIEEYISSANPIGSAFLVKKKKMDCCSATVRNSMMDLEKAGYLYQPHTSAGRIPTENAYKLYTRELNKDEKINQKIEKKIEAFLSELNIKDRSTKSKVLAKIIAEVSKNSVLLAFSKHNYYITGFSNILSQVEFEDPEKLRDLSLVFDELENIVERMFKGVSNNDVLIGSENEFSKHLSVIASRANLVQNEGFLAILGPMRMNYKQNLGLINYFKKVMI